MPGGDFQAVRCLVSIAQVLERIGFVPAECSGDQVRGPCPVHDQTRRKAVHSRQIRDEMLINVSNAAPRVISLICGRP